MIGKALSHQPRILFLDEPTALVDVELRKDMWDIVRELKEDGVTIARQHIISRKPRRSPTGWGDQWR